MITITASNGSKGRGETVADASRQLLGDRVEVSVQAGRGWFIPIEEATTADVRRSRALWVKSARSWKVGLLVDKVTESAPAP